MLGSVRGVQKEKRGAKKKNHHKEQTPNSRWERERERESERARERERERRSYANANGVR
jgi:hypothetical protein